MSFITDHISHYGVKGQKWGVRREMHKTWVKGAKSGETATAVYNDAAKSFNKVLPKLNKDPAFSDMATNRKTRKQYDAVVQVVFNQHLATASLEKTYNKDLNRGIIYQMTPDGRHMRATEVKAVAGHADISDQPDYELVRDAEGFVTSCHVVETIMSQEDEVQAFLEHHGVKGQRWGVRRTKAALARAARREGRPQSEDAARAKALSKKKRSELTNDELRFLNERQNLEQNNRRLNPGVVDKGQAKTRAILGTVGLGVAAYNTIKSPAGQAAVRAGKNIVSNYFGTLPINVP